MVLINISILIYLVFEREMENERAQPSRQKIVYSFT